MSQTVQMDLTPEEAASIQAARQKTTTNSERRVLIGFVIDESGSMSGCVEDTIGGYNHFLDDQAKEPGVALATRIQFNTLKSDPPTPLTPVATAERLDAKKYRPAGMTPLWDSVGRMIEHLTVAQLAEDAVILVVLTDGLENSSREYNKDRIRKLVDEKKATGKWTVVFLGADFDASTEASAVGVGAANTMNYDKRHTQVAVAGLSAATRSFRSTYGAGGQGMSADLGAEAGRLMQEEIEREKTSG